MDIDDETRIKNIKELLSAIANLEIDLMKVSYSDVNDFIKKWPGIKKIFQKVEINQLILAPKYSSILNYEENGELEKDLEAVKRFIRSFLTQQPKTVDINNFRKLLDATQKKVFESFLKLF